MLKYTLDNYFLLNYKDTLLSKGLVNVYQSDHLPKQLEQLPDIF